MLGTQKYKRNAETGHEVADGWVADVEKRGRAPSLARRLEPGAKRPPKLLVAGRAIEMDR